MVVALNEMPHGLDHRRLRPTVIPESAPAPQPAPKPLVSATRGKCCPVGAVARNRVERRNAARVCRLDACPLRRPR